MRLGADHQDSNACPTCSCSAAVRHSGVSYNYERDRTVFHTMASIPAPKISEVWVIWTGLIRVLLFAAPFYILHCFSKSSFRFPIMRFLLLLVTDFIFSNHHESHGISVSLGFVFVLYCTVLEWKFRLLYKIRLIFCFFETPLSTAATFPLFIPFWLCRFPSVRLYCLKLILMFRDKPIMTNRGFQKKKSSILVCVFVWLLLSITCCGFINYGNFSTRVVDCVLGEYGWGIVVVMV